MKDGRPWVLLWAALAAARRQRHLELPEAAQRAVLDLARDRGVAGLVGEALDLPPEIDVERWSAGRATLRAVDDALDKAGVAHVFFKGPLADGVLWAGRGLRRATDVDVLVAPADEIRAVDALAKIHFLPLKLPGFEAQVAAGKARVLVPRHPLLLPVDLHRRPLDAPPFAARTEHVLGDARRYETRDGAVPGPCPEQMVVWSAGNLAGGRLQGLVAQAADAAAWVERPGFRWDVVVATARRWRAGVPTWGLLRLLEARLEVQVPHAVLGELAPASRVAQRVERVFGAVGSPVEMGRGLPALFLVEWPLSGRALWPAQRAARTLALRAVDAVLVRRRGRDARRGALR